MTLTIRHLTYTLQKHSLIEEISLDFKSGLLYAILGPNGSGKSTLLKTLARILTPTQGKIFWHDQDLLRFSRKQLSRTLSLVPQNPQLNFDFTVYQMTLMGRYPLGDEPQMLSLRPQRYSSEGERSVEEALRQVDAWHLRDRPLSGLSGGERQRVYIARALTTEAPILLLDEPTSDLDLRHQLEIWDHLQTLTKQGKLVIAAVHDLCAARRFCDQVVVLNQGRCHATGSYAEVMTPALLHDIFGVVYGAEGAEEESGVSSRKTNAYLFELSKKYP